MVKYLVLGSSGVIGKPLVEYITAQGHTAIEFDLVNNPEQDLRLPGNQQLQFALEQADFCFFLACDIGGSNYLLKNQYNFDFLQNNATILTNTFDALKKSSVPFIFTSSQMSSMTYSSYGTIKRLGEYYTEGLGGINTRFWNVYGAEAADSKAHALTDFIQQARTSGHIRMLTDGNESRQLLHSKDCSRALYQLAQMYNSLPKDSCYDITSFQWTTIRELAHAVADLFPGCQVTPGAGMDLVQQDRLVEPSTFILDYWQPEISLAEGVRLVVKDTQ